jgi:hypothetical protein
MLAIIPLLAFSSVAESAATKDNSTYTLLEPLPCIPSKGVTCKSGDLQIVPKVKLNEYIPFAFNLLIALAAVAAVFMIVWGGIEYMTTDSWTGKSAGLSRARNAIIGLLMVLGTYLLLRTVNPKLVDLTGSIVPRADNLPQESSSGFFDQLAADAAKYDSDTQQAAAAREAAKTAIKADELRLSDLQQQYSDADASGDFYTASMLAAEISTVRDDIVAKASEQTLNTYKGAIEGSMNVLTKSRDQNGEIDLQSNDLATIKKSGFLVDKAYAEGRAKMAIAGDDPLNKQALADQYNYTRGQLTIAEQLKNAESAHWWNTKNNDAISEINAQVGQNVLSISNPTLRHQLQQQMNASLETLRH